ncbi:hypothetical protein BDK92_2203 [Micromonospora pisi]|uniref:Uncharacterized protein n=1 Tax=Micromonospora pisi TaxID=589240 RepID=A0A495JHT7_9ACTN|nr:hypothetical protein [Micromonospora pisi]RKR87902.1 hypothetical protein BDK92_2203 [Micromonospora pisi]
MALVTPHWHAYGPWTGPHQFFSREHEHERRPGNGPGDAGWAAFVAATTPPMQTGHYLLRRDQTARERTWIDVQGPLTWLAETYAQLPPDPALSYMELAERLEYTGQSLRHGGDTIWHYTTSKSGNRLVVFAVICCPHRHLTAIPCPLPPN